MSKKEFYIYRFNLLQAYFAGCLSKGKKFFSTEEAYAYAWSHEIYPVFDACFADEEFKNDFSVKEDYVKKVSAYLNSIVTDYDTKKITSFPSYYDIQSALGSKSNNLNLTEVLRYIYLSKKFNIKDLWDSIVQQGNAPSEADKINSPFDKNIEISIFLA
jgi:hypothetical protein